MSTSIHAESHTKLRGLRRPQFRGVQFFKVSTQLSCTVLSIFRNKPIVPLHPLILYCCVRGGTGSQQC